MAELKLCQMEKQHTRFPLQTESSQKCKRRLSYTVQQLLFSRQKCQLLCFSSVSVMLILSFLVLQVSNGKQKYFLDVVGVRETMATRSRPMPKPPVGGSPYSRQYRSFHHLKAWPIITCSLGLGLFFKAAAARGIICSVWALHIFFMTNSSERSVRPLSGAI